MRKLEVDYSWGRFTRHGMVALALTCLAAMAQGQTADTALAEATALLTEARKKLDASEGQQVLPMVERALQIRQEKLGAEHVETVAAMNTLGRAYAAHDDYVEAEKTFLRVIELRTRLLGAEHRDTAGTFSQLGILYLDLGRFDAAERALQRALTIREKLSGPLHPEVGSSMSRLAIVYLISVGALRHRLSDQRAGVAAIQGAPPSSRQRGSGRRS
jgi:tetratricopeptide (TPR) repeat protein